ncbi:MAG: DUF11 domain-containing protein, partial [Actinobacteria bacterium]
SCTPGTNDANVLVSGDKTVTAPATVPDSNAFGPLGSGDYSYQATYNGNGNYNSATGACEPFHVNKATPSISTVVKDGNNATVDNDTHKAALGVTVHDTATLADGVTGFSFDGTATVTYKLFSNLSCTAGTNDANLLVSGDKTVTAPATVPDSNAFGPLGSGDYSYQATYNGNGNYNSATGACEPFHVGKATPSVTTTLKNAAGDATIENGSSVALGSGVYDTAALGGKVDSLSFDGTDTVTYHFFANGTCTGDPLDTDTVTVASDTVPKSKTESNLAAGHYAFNATYNGNANYTAKTSDCEPFTVISPSISISKTPDSQTIRNPGTASWTITVKNTGDATLTNVHVTDAQAPGCERTAEQIAAARGSSTFDPGESYSYDCSLAGVTASFTNTAVATGTPPVGEDVTAHDSADVRVINPHLTILKTPDQQTIVAGQTASFTIQVINDGDSTLTNVVVTDALAPGCARTSADISGLASMPAAPAAGSTITYTCTLANVTASFTNTAVATGKPEVGPNVSSQDTAAVTVVPPVTHPAISIVKDPKSQTVTSGGTATFTITVLNTGDTTLTDVVVTDALSPNCNRTIGTLAPGASVSYKCTRPNVTKSFTNVAVVTGKAGGTTLTAQDTAPVTAKKPFVPKVVPKVVSHKKPKATG